ncbi:hypothetical protein HFV02_03110 [Acidithiobacillus caldus]|uniref:hypothetical protein n=1 Tax=Acidithiobacillus caldus TaxID=33059 RepID=UPI001C0665FC|nr:hypothetical protein [Acidithiobacillus caldus]MBU2801256.1 hypothetical protein [Acidithiobacillus caldus]
MSPFANVGNAVVSKLAQVYGPDLKVLGAAILVLVGGIVGVWFLLRLFGVRIGLSETAKQRIRDKAAKRKAAFPFKFSYAGNAGKAKAADASGPWIDPAKGVLTQGELWDREGIEADFEFFSSAGLSDMWFALAEGDSNPRIQNVTANWSNFFSSYGSLEGLASAENVDEHTKMFIYRHASRLIKMRMDALYADREDWAKAYAGDYESRPMKFSA